MPLFDSPSQLEAALALAPLEHGAFRFVKQYGPAAFLCSQCKCSKPLNTDGNGGTGYARNAADAFICYECCAEDDRRDMIETGKAVLYLTDDKVTNWPGTLSFACSVKRGHHNIARYRYDAWFIGPDGKQWHGVQYGDNTQIIRCRRTKA